MLVEKVIYGSKMLLDTNDGPHSISADLWRDGTREWDCPQKVHQYVTEGMTCLCVGSSIGYYALMCAKLVRNFGHVYAIEPLPSNVEIVKQAIALNDYKNISVHELAIGSYDGTNTFLVRPQSNLGRLRTTSANEMKGYTPLEVRQMTLDSFVEEQGIEKVDFINFDIESAEVELVAGAEKTLGTDITPKGAVMFAEWHTCHFDDPARDMMPALQQVLDWGWVPRHCIPVQPMESIPLDEFACEACTTYRKAAPRIFFEKV
jgi:FkbM family methyltransferase